MAFSSQFMQVRANRKAFGGGTDELPTNFSWVIEEKIGGCAIPTEASQIEGLKAKGVGLVVSCIESHACPPLDYFDGVVEHLHLEWRNYSTPTIPQMQQFVEKASKVIADGHSVVIHCFAGKGRTGTALACYLIATDNMSAAEAIAKVRECRPGSIETESQESFLVDFANKVHPERKEEHAPSSNSNPFLKVKLRPTNPQTK